ncbi:unnamed protein product [Anisakis simplex]|uniref:Probable prefoldin subunit 5 (inferred by orthology to a C. elegans protein) n=1 Tax=Anisakis simplex TaxID=6269 RepID=A0A0M3K752_ANISI|nr:unnamed protein product [Anisakis simplex]
MNHAAGDKKQTSSTGLPITDLSIEQLTSLQKQVEQEITFFSESLAVSFNSFVNPKNSELKVFEAKFEASEEAVCSIDPKAERTTALIPLSESMYINAELADPSNVLVEIGTGYYAEMNLEKAKDFFKRKQEYLRKQISTVEDILPEKRRIRQAITENIQKKIQTLCAQLPQSSSTK